MKEEISLLLVFAAGLLSFLSPCVLPLIPSYLGILGGMGIGQKSRYRLFFAAMAFTVGFSAVFIIFGIMLSTTFFLMGGILFYINRAAGIVVIILGLNVIFDFLSFLNYEKRPFLNKFSKFNSGIPSAFIAGAAFGTGWTPCIGPILSGILLLAAREGRTGAAVFYLSVYSFGLALPFLLAALFFDTFTKNVSRLHKYLPLIRRISGVLLIIIGIMIFTGQYTAINQLIQKLIFSYIDWAETAPLPFRLLAKALSWVKSF